MSDVEVHSLKPDRDCYSERVRAALCEGGRPDLCRFVVDIGWGNGFPAPSFIYLSLSDECDVPILFRALKVAWFVGPDADHEDWITGNRASCHRYWREKLAEEANGTLCFQTDWDDWRDRFAALGLAP